MKASTKKRMPTLSLGPSIMRFDTVLLGHPCHSLLIMLMDTLFKKVLLYSHTSVEKKWIHNYVKQEALYQNCKYKNFPGERFLILGWGQNGHIVLINVHINYE